MFQYIGLGKDIFCYQFTNTGNKICDKLDYHKLKLLHDTETHQNNEDITDRIEKISASHVSDKGLIFRIYQLIKNSRQKQSSFQKTERHRLFHKDSKKMANKGST